MDTNLTSIIQDFEFMTDSSRKVLVHMKQLKSA